MRKRERVCVCAPTGKSVWVSESQTLYKQQTFWRFVVFIRKCAFGILTCICMFWTMSSNAKEFLYEPHVLNRNWKVKIPLFPDGKAYINNVLLFFFVSCNTFGIKWSSKNRGKGLFVSSVWKTIRSYGGSGSPLGLINPTSEQLNL